LPFACAAHNSCVIIRAHGIDREKEAALKNSCVDFVDATCPKVKNCQLLAEKLSAAAYTIFLAGEKEHDEVLGVESYAKNTIVVSSTEEARRAAETLLQKMPLPEKTALISQTTFSVTEFTNIARVIKEYFPRLELHCTICSATEERQKALESLCPLVDALIIAGSPESANTRRLLQIAEASGKPACLVESADKIPQIFFLFNSIGISAGASTPDHIVDEIQNKLESYSAELTPLS
jgi:4-hydroxy-3-methylbut-2-enyl diphosphate reductase